MLSRMMLHGVPMGELLLLKHSRFLRQLFWVIVTVGWLAIMWVSDIVTRPVLALEPAKCINLSVGNWLISVRVSVILRAPRVFRSSLLLSVFWTVLWTALPERLQSLVAHLFSRLMHLKLLMLMTCEF